MPTEMINSNDSNWGHVNQGHTKGRPFILKSRWKKTLSCKNLKIEKITD